MFVRFIVKSAVAAMILSATPAMSQESEFVGKIQEDLDGYKDQVKSNCGIAPRMAWTGGKLGSNPRESAKPEWNAVSTLCTSAIDGMNQACSNAVVKKGLKKVTSIECEKGKGTIAYALKGSTLTFKIDPAFTANNASGQTADLVEKMKKNMDK